jgi:2-dehydropantoate 2-reductase
VVSRIAVVGAGAIGCVFGGYLAARGRHEMTFCVREGFDEITVEAPSGTLQSPARAVTSPVGLGPTDWVILAVKAHQVEGTAGWLSALCGSETRVAVLQNGVEHVERTAPFSGTAKVFPVTINCPAVKLGPGRTSQLGQARLIAGEGEVGRAFAELFSGTDARIQLSADMKTTVWRKLCNNMSCSVITVLTNKPVGVFRQPGLLDLSAALLKECIAVGRAEGASLGDEVIDEVVTKHKTAPPDLMPSMLMDRRAGRTLETDAQYGVIVRLGERHGIDTPLCRAAAALLGALNGGSDI